MKDMSRVPVLEIEIGALGAGYLALAIGTLHSRRIKTSKSHGDGN